MFIQFIGKAVSHTVVHGPDELGCSSNGGETMPIGSSNESDSSAGGSSSGGSRGGSNKQPTPVVVKGRYGTQQVMPDTECEETGEDADGVMIVEREIDGSGKTYEEGIPLSEQIWTGMCETQGVDDMENVRWETFK